jgi:hypothetical protein
MVPLKIIRKFSSGKYRITSGLKNILRRVNRPVNIEPPENIPIETNTAQLTGLYLLEMPSAFLTLFFRQEFFLH